MAVKLLIEIVVNGDYDEPEKLNELLFFKTMDVAKHFDGLDSIISGGACNDKFGKASYKLEHIDGEVKLEQ